MSFCKHLKVLSFLSVFIFLTGLISVHAQESPNSLFWEISGNGLTKPSYIYGTIHIKDKRVFNLSDSALIKLDECPALAVEIDLDSARLEAVRIGIMQSNPADNENDSQNDPGKYFTDEEEIIVKRGLAKITGMNEDEINLNNPTIIFFLITQFKYQSGNMPEILDQRIFNLAKSKGKKLSGIETFEEQMNTFSSLEYSGLKKAILQELDDLSSADSSLKVMINTYCSQDLRKINSILRSNESEYPDFYHKLFDVRNIRMAERISGIIRSTQTFIAVGVGHLYGEKGIISLLTEKGFSLRPVYPSYSKRLAENFINFEAENNLKKFTCREGAFEAGFPNDPVYDLKKIPVEGLKDSLLIFFRASLDNTGESSFIVKYNDVGNGRYVPNDSLYFEQSIAGALGNTNGTLVYKRFRKFLNLPAVEYKINVMNKITAKAIQFLRGSRDYGLITTQVRFDSLTTEKFFDSFRLLDFMPVSWKSFSDSTGSFRIDFPSDNILQESNSPKSRNLQSWKNFMNSDPNSGQSFLLQEQMFSDYYQVESDSALLESCTLALTGETDSLISENTFTWNGMPARDLIIRSSLTENSRRIRFILNGQKLYLLFTCAPEAWMNENIVTHFFDSFKISERAKNPEMLFADKTEKLLSDIVSSDINIRKAAADFLPEHTFQAKSLPQIYSLLKMPFDDDSSSKGGTRVKLLKVLQSVNDSTTVGFISELYPELPENSLLPAVALKILSAINTKESVNKMKQLLIARPPAGDNPGGIFSHFFSESSNVNLLFPDILTLLGKEKYKSSIYSMISTFIDSVSGMKNDLQAYDELIKGDFRRFASRRDSLKSIPQTDSEANPDLFNNDILLQIMTGFIHTLKRDIDTENILLKLAADSSGYLSLNSAVALIKLQGNCEKGVLNKLAEDRYTRNELYSQLQQIGKENLFPSKYKTKDMMAESGMYIYILNEEYTPAELVLLDRKEVTISGEKGIYYLYKFNLEGEEENWYVGISGPQPADTEEPVAYGTATGTDFTIFSNDIEKHWKELLQEESE